METQALMAAMPRNVGSLYAFGSMRRARENWRSPKIVSQGYPLAQHDLNRAAEHLKKAACSKASHDGLGVDDWRAVDRVAPAFGKLGADYRNRCVTRRPKAMRKAQAAAARFEFEGFVSLDRRPLGLAAQRR